MLEVVLLVEVVVGKQVVVKVDGACLESGHVQVVVVDFVTKLICL
jgi:hypothetical protein